MNPLLMAFCFLCQRLSESIFLLVNETFFHSHIKPLKRFMFYLFFVSPTDKSVGYAIMYTDKSVGSSSPTIKIVGLSFVLNHKANCNSLLNIKNIFVFTSVRCFFFSVTISVQIKNINFIKAVH